MISRRDLVSTVFIQGLGVLATLAISIVVAHRLGAQGQGFWANFRSVLDFTAVIAAYGFPAAIPFLINVRGVGPQKILAFTVSYALLLVPLVAIAIFLAHFSGLLKLQTTDTYTEIGLLTISAVTVASHSMLRSLSLSTASNTLFNTISTLLPAALLLFLMLWPLPDATALMPAVASGAVFSLVLSGVLLHQYKDPSRWHAGGKLPMREMFAFGGWNFAVAAMTAASAVFTMQALSGAGVTTALIGCFSIAVLVQGALLTPANLAGPLAYNAWSRERDPLARLRSYGNLMRASFLMSIVMLVIAWFMMPLLPLIFGHDFEAAIAPGRILLLAVPLGYIARLMANVLMAIGQVQGYAVAVAFRLAAIVLIMKLAPTASIQTAALAWLVAEGAGVLASAVALRRTLNWSWFEISGLAWKKAP